MGVSESAAAMPEQLVFNQMIGQRAAVDRDEWAFARAAERVDGMGEHLFACPGLACN